MKHSALSLRQMKSVTAIPMLTAYTTPIARCLEHADIPVILVGDTVGMVEMGFASTREVTIDHIVYHIGAVRRRHTSSATCRTTAIAIRRRRSPAHGVCSKPAPTA